jgi:hypothetical protein
LQFSKYFINHPIQKIVVALNEAIRLMQEIDYVIDHHGGWPDAFVGAGMYAGRVENRIQHPVGRAYLLPPLSSGGASIALP